MIKKKPPLYARLMRQFRKIIIGNYIPTCPSCGGDGKDSDSVICLCYLPSWF